MANNYKDKCEDFKKKGNVGTKLFIAGASGLISLLIVIAGFKGCEGKGIIGDITYSTSSTDPSKDNDPTNPTFDTESQNVTESETTNIYDNMVEYVNEDVYKVLLKAKDNCSILLDNGDSLSNKLVNNSIKINANDLEYIESNMKILYDHICKYISSYNNKKFDKCCEYATSLVDFYSVFSQGYLYSVLVGNNLENEYQSNIKYDEFGDVVYQNGNICLNDGKQIRFIGSSDEIVGDDLNDDFISKMKWLERIPRLLFNKYSQFKNTSDDDVCYIMNETSVGDLCSSEVNSIISEGSEEYGFDKKNVTIKSINDQLTFVGDNNKIYGILSYDQTNRYNTVSEIRVAVTNKSGDALVLDSYVSDLIKSDNNYTYNK